MIVVMDSEELKALSCSAVGDPLVSAIADPVFVYRIFSGINSLQ